MQSKMEQRPNSGRISVVINTYNAERDLKQVLESVKKFDEIVVCDMESTDQTIAIAKSYGCKIVTFPKANHMSAEPARTFAIQSASNEWVLVVDADEIITSELHKYLYEYIGSDNHKCGLYIPRKNYIMGCFMKSSYPDYQLRFFKREGTMWPPYVHTFPKVDGPTEKIPKGNQELAMIHLDNTTFERIKKLNEYTENEVEKRSNKHVSFMKMVCEPAFCFFKAYILKGGIRYGKIGLIQATHKAIYRFIVLQKILESQNKQKILCHFNEFCDKMTK